MVKQIAAVAIILLLASSVNLYAKDNATFTKLHTVDGFEVAIPKTLVDDEITLTVAWQDVKVREIDSIDFRESAVWKINSKGEIFIDGYATVVTKAGKTMKGHTRVYTQ
jgi:hypothetical protein